MAKDQPRHRAVNPDQRIFLIGLYINSALYLSACAAIGYLSGNPLAWKLAVAGMGLAYLGYYGAVDGRVNRLLTFLTSASSIVAGFGAGMALLVRP